MIGFYFAFLAVLLSGLGARDQATVAGMALRQPGRLSLLVMAIATSFATAAFAAWAADTVAPLMVPKARLFLAALALGFAGVESLVIAPGRKPQEPTGSLGAFAIVLLAHQLTDAARFLVFAIAAATASPVTAGIGGAAGGAAVVAAGWLLPDLCSRPVWRKARRWIGVLLLALSLWLALRVFGKL